MKRRGTLTWLLVMPLWLGGCLLPQPDTPPVPPGPASGSMSKRGPQPAPVQAPNNGDVGAISNNAGGPISNNAGGLIPQPDTPPVAPGMAPPQAAAGATADRSGMPEGENSLSAPAAMASTAPRLPGTLSGRFSGLTVTYVTVFAEGTTEVVDKQAIVDSADFSFGLPAGRYTLSLQVDGKLLKIAQAFEVRSDETRKLVIALKRDPLSATVTEEVTLVESTP